MTIRLMLVDDQVLLRTGFRMVLAAQPDMEVVAEAGDGVEALQVLRSTPVDVVLMDVRMPKLDGVETTRRICSAPDAPRVLILTTFDLDEYAFSGLKAGASGFMLKDVPPHELLAAIRAVHSGDAVVAPSTTRRLLDRFSSMLPTAGSGQPQHRALDRLTDREREVMLLVAQGLSNGEIAARLVLSEATVKTHVGRILTKLELRDRVQVVVLSYETGLVRAGGGPPAPDSLIWLNGPFGGGKTQTAYELHRRLPGSVVCDPEEVGFGLHRMTPRPLRGDFQDLAAWRHGVREVLDLVLRRHEAGGPVLAPMTLVEPAYFAEIVGALRDAGHDVRHYALLARRETVLRRLAERGLGRGLKRESFAVSRLDHCLERLALPDFAEHVRTDRSTVPQVAEAVAASAGLSLLPNTDGPFRHRLRRARVGLRHIRHG